ncbi:hypothetical protein INS49_014777 [Diaporthe citri]|uniref:uncharacterized protein n=1 Tax=Diaporthe citri TaxID=83186 RepID=UPI001C805EC3|nr:uncharacterized protein INS49_014777 [Diaporthe citri]KAG6356902.1 hypothetical protein INS49_014777 [Diaporthe citri]
MAQCVVNGPPRTAIIDVGSSNNYKQHAKKAAVAAANYHQPTPSFKNLVQKHQSAPTTPIRPVVIVASVATLRRSAGADQQQAAPLLPQLVSLSTTTKSRRHNHMAKSQDEESTIALLEKQIQKAKKKDKTPGTKGGEASKLFNEMMEEKDEASSSEDEASEPQENASDEALYA